MWFLRYLYPNYTGGSGVKQIFALNFYPFLLTEHRNENMPLNVFLIRIYWRQLVPKLALAFTQILEKSFACHFCFIDT